MYTSDIDQWVPCSNLTAYGLAAKASSPSVTLSGNHEQYYSSLHNIIRNATRQMHELIIKCMRLK